MGNRERKPESVPRAGDGWVSVPAGEETNLTEGKPTELIRRRVRAFLGYDNPVYRTASRVADLGCLLWREGFSTTRQLLRLRRASPGRRPSGAVSFRQLAYPFHLRPGTEDVDTLVSNIVREEYGRFPLERDGSYFIVDAGAYIGDTAAYFLSRYPQATVVALEPALASFELARENLAPYGPRAVVLNKALWKMRTRLSLSGGKTGARLGSGGGIEVETTTVPELLNLAPGGRIDILKLDIEGAEKGLFREGAETWLRRVDCIILETHGPECERVVFGALERAGWRRRRYRNLHYCFPEPQLMTIRPFPPRVGRVGFITSSPAGSGTVFRSGMSSRGGEG